MSNTARLLVASDTFVAADGVRFVEGHTLVWDDDPIVAQYPAMFRPATAHYRSPGMVEQATAGPGERRG